MSTIPRISSEDGRGQRAPSNDEIVVAVMDSFDRVETSAFSGEVIEADIVWDVDAAAEVTETGQVLTPHLGQGYHELVTGYGAGALFPLSDMSGTTAQRSSGSGFSGTYAEPVQPVPGPFPAVASNRFFDGQSVIVNAPSDWLATPLTISGWVRVPGPTSANRTIVSQQDGSGTGRSVLLVSSPNGGEFGTFLGGSYRSLECAPSGSWQHVALTSTGSQITFYLDGELVHTSACDPEAASGSFVLGSAKDRAQLFLLGDMAYFGLTIGVLSQTQIREMVLMRRSPQTVNLTPTISSIGADGVLVGENDGLARVAVTDGRTGRELRQNILAKTGVEAREFNRYAYGSLGKAGTDAVVNGISGMTKAANGNIYDSQNHSTPAFIRNDECWLPASLLTGISPSNTQSTNKRAGTAISPRHIALAKHYQISVGQTIRFVTADNTVIERTIIGRAAAATNDTAVATLDADLPASVRFYPVFSEIEDMERLAPAVYQPNIPWPHGYPPVVMLDQQEKTILGGLRWANGSGVFHWPTSNAADITEWNEEIVPGDSGNPLFFYPGAELVLLTTHHTSGSGPFLTKASLDPLMLASDADAGVTTGYLATAYDQTEFEDYTRPDPEAGLTLDHEEAPVGIFPGFDFSTARMANIVMACDLVMPATPTGCIFECGGGGTGSYVGFDGDGSFRVRCGDGGALPRAGAASLVLPPGSVSGSGTLVWEFAANGSKLRVWWRRRLIAEATATTPEGAWGGTDGAGYLRSNSGVPSGTNTANCNGAAGASDLRIYAGELSSATPDYAEAVLDDHPLATWNLDGAPEVFDGTRAEQIGTGADGRKVSSGPFTLEGIVSLDSTAKDGTIIGRWEQPAEIEDRRFILFFDTGGGGGSFSAAFRETGGGTISIGESPSGYTVSALTEYHVALTYDGSTVRVYVDGVERHSASNVLPEAVGPVQLWVGDDDDTTGSYDRYLDGTLRGCAIYDKALRPDRVALHARLV